MRQRIKKTLSQRKDSNFFLRRNKPNTNLLHSDKGTLRSQFGDTVFFGAASQRDSKESLPATSSARKRKGLFSSLTLLVLDKPVVTGLRRSRQRDKSLPVGRRFTRKCEHFLDSDSYDWAVVTSEILSEKVSSGLTNTYFYKSFTYSGTAPLVLASLALLFLVGCLVNPVGMGTEKVSATTITEEECQSGHKIGLTLAGVTNGDNVQLTNENVSADIEAGSISKLAQDFNVVACNAEDYRVYLQAETSLLKNQQAPDALYGVGENVAEVDFPENTWGYNVSPKGNTNNLTYNTVPELASTISEAYKKQGSTTNTGDNLTVTFAAKFGNNKTAGHYESDILLSAVITPATLMSWDELTYMQDMTPYACNGGTEEGKQLIDKRDGKSYWVAKLKDGNCWMTQNLDLDLKQGETLTPELSDIINNWTPGEGEGTIATGELNAKAWPNTYNIIRSYDPGVYVYTKPDVAEKCSDISENGMIGDACEKYGWIDVAGMTASDAPTFGVEVVDGVYNAHYLIGNYYSWDAAVAGQASAYNRDSIYPVEMAQSICPSGWRLPVGDSVANSDFFRLFNAYGERKENGFAFGQQDIRLAPLYFLLGGSIYKGAVGNVGLNGYYLLPELNKYNTSAYLGLYGSSGSSGVSLVKNARSEHGLSVRCVAR